MIIKKFWEMHDAALVKASIPCLKSDGTYGVMGLDQPRPGQFDNLGLGRTGAAYDSACSPVNGLAGAIRAAGSA